MTQTLERPKVNTSKEAIESAIYGLARLVAGYESWKNLEDTPCQERIRALVIETTSSFNSLAQDYAIADPQQQASLLRKLRAFHQLATLEKFCFEEVDWDD